MEIDLKKQLEKDMKEKMKIDLKQVEIKESNATESMIFTMNSSRRGFNGNYKNVSSGVALTLGQDYDQSPPPPSHSQIVLEEVPSKDNLSVESDDFGESGEEKV